VVTATLPRSTVTRLSRLAAQSRDPLEPSRVTIEQRLIYQLTPDKGSSSVRSSRMPCSVKDYFLEVLPGAPGHHMTDGRVRNSILSHQCCACPTLGEGGPNLPDFLSFSFALACCSHCRLTSAAVAMFSDWENVLRWQTRLLVAQRSVTIRPSGSSCLRVEANRRT
jgi:hypothetical protein